jgi:adenine-specific DNA methylase
MQDISRPDTQVALFPPPSPKRFSSVPTRTALEDDFPIGLVSLLAEKESWRKEIHRPATHTHKWWAQRLGTVFRSILLGGVATSASELTEALGAKTSLEGLVVFDPFAGSGTTLVEAAKLGCRVIGRDINPVATLVQRQAISAWDFAKIEALFKEVERECRDEIDELYRSHLGDDVLYYFWVSVAICPVCLDDVELFSDFVFARHAYPRRHPVARAVCPVCKGIVVVDLSNDRDVRCDSCGARSSFDGPVRGQFMTCAKGHQSRVVEALARERPRYSLYCKLVADGGGGKRYESIDDHDLRLFAEAGSRLARDRRALPQPHGRLEEGYNTRQALRWGFSSWQHFFNDRQLYCLGRLGDAVRALSPMSSEREALVALFSGTLEFNNIFCSYKGEGTGAVRHLFSHHVLRPERTPLEANPWGTPLSSGSFSTLFERRLRRAHDYKIDPHDLQMVGGSPKRVWGRSDPLPGHITTTYDEFSSTGARFYVATGDSACTDLPEGSVDLIVTDPPFMDNVHYSELADFFHAWLGAMHPFRGYPATVTTTRREGEVQNVDPGQFGLAIAKVLKECGRVLKQEGLLALTFHQARVAGWVHLMTALRAAGFVVTAVQPVKAEMSVSATKSGAGEPSNVDSIVVCRKSPASPVTMTPAAAAALATEKLLQLRSVGISISRTDVTSVVTGTVLSLATGINASPVDELCTAAAAESACAARLLIDGA